MKEWLDFEEPIATLESKIEELRTLCERDPELELQDEIDRLTKKSNQLTQNIFQKLSAWEVVRVARHPNRPQSAHYIDIIADDFFELKGDRCGFDDPSITGGILKIENHAFIFVGQNKGGNTKEKIEHNFGMSRPEGYRKAHRLFELAQELRLPILTMVDTPGAYPGIDAERHNQSESIASNLEFLAGVEVPVIAIVTGEGGSGGALALSVADHLVMLQYSVYSVISPEGCASILWKDIKMAAQASQIMKMTAQDLLSFKLIDQILEEPLGGAHRAPKQAADSIKALVLEKIKQLEAMSVETRLEQRYEKIMRLGTFKESK